MAEHMLTADEKRAVEWALRHAIAALYAEARAFAQPATRNLAILRSADAKLRAALRTSPTHDPEDRKVNDG